MELVDRTFETKESGIYGIESREYEKTYESHCIYNFSFGGNSKN